MIYRYQDSVNILILVQYICLEAFEIPYSVKSSGKFME